MPTPNYVKTIQRWLNYSRQKHLNMFTIYKYNLYKYDPYTYDPCRNLSTGNTQQFRSCDSQTFHYRDLEFV